MEDLFKRLGNFLKKIKQKIFPKKEKEKEQITFEVIAVDKIELNKEEDKILYNLLNNNNREFEFSAENSQINMEMLEKIFNAYYPNLPKRYLAKTLILSVAAAQSCDYQMVDISQYEERQLIHICVGTTKTVDRIEEEFQKEYPELAQFDEMEEEQWENDLTSTIFHNVEVFYYEDLNLWTWEIPEEDE